MISVIYYYGITNIMPQGVLSILKFNYKIQILFMYSPSSYDIIYDTRQQGHYTNLMKNKLA